MFAHVVEEIGRLDVTMNDAALVHSIQRHDQIAYVGAHLAQVPEEKRLTERNMVHIRHQNKDMALIAQDCRYSDHVVTPTFCFVFNFFNLSFSTRLYLKDS